MAAQEDDEPTPVINGYKPVRTPTYFQVPSTPLREEFGIQLAKATDLKKREQKRQEKEIKQEKLSYTPMYSEKRAKSISTPSHHKISSEAGKQLLRSVQRKTPLRAQATPLIRH